MAIDKKSLYKWCSIKAEDLHTQNKLKIPFRMVEDSYTLGNIMANDFLEEIILASQEKRKLRAIVPCGPKAWYKPFTDKVNQKNISLKHLEVFHMDECLDWQGRLLAKDDPYNFRTFMEKYFYEPIRPELQVHSSNRFFPEPTNLGFIKENIQKAPIDLCLGGWGQDGHIAYNQARRQPYGTLSLEDLRNAELRIQENNQDTILALAHRTFGAAYQFVPPMSVTLGIKECFSAKKIRLYSDTGAWKQTALRVALFSEPTVEYPMTLLQEHSDALITATLETARHPISENPEWKFTDINT
jgi:glucosamine-6-phosphate deaminase